MGTQTEAFWDRIYENTPYSHKPDERIACALKSAHTFFQPASGDRILDIGCGGSATPIFWASTGAHVTAIDSSTSAIKILRERCANLGITNVKPLVCDAMNVEELGQFDYVFGSLILHHIEPFSTFAASLRRAVRPGGKGFFYENSAASAVLIWLRSRVAGRLWVPKYGDAEEFPLTLDEVNVLRDFFKVQVSFPKMMFFHLASVYLFRGRFGFAMKAIDNFLYKHNIGVRYSNRQYLLLDTLEASVP